MAYSINSGLVDDQDILANERVVEMSDVFDLIEEDTTQFTSAMRKVSSRNIESSKPEWIEDRLFPRISALAASASSADSAFTVTAGEGNYFAVGDLVRILPSGEALEVTAVAASSITATRSIGSVAAASAQTGAELVIVGNAYSQGATLGTPKVLKRVAAYNYTQIVRHPYSFTRTLTQSRLYGGNEPNKERRKKGVEHKRALEQLMFFGARELDTTGDGGTEPKGFMGGLQEFVTQNVHAVNGTLSATAFDSYLQDDLEFGNDKVLFCAPVIARSLSYFAANNWVQSTPNDKLYGIKVDAFYSGAYGYKLPVFVKRDWNEFSGAIASGGYGYGSWGFIVDMSAVQLLKLQDTVLLRNRQANDADRVTEEYLTEMSLEVRAGGDGFSVGKHAILKGVTGPA